MMDPQQAAVAREFNAYGDSYEAAVNKAIGFSGLNLDFFVRAKAEHLKRAVAAHFGAAGATSALDIGCGIGQYHRLIADTFPMIIGIDVSEEAIKRAAVLNPELEYRAFDGRAIPYPAESFDVAFAICVLHHVPVNCWLNFAAEMKRVLRPDGLALLFEHNPRHPLTRKAVRDCPFDRDAVLLRPERALALFHAAGFGRVALEHILTIPAVSGAPKVVDSFLGRFGMGAQYCVAASA